jgi:hypothetical protein
VTNVQLRSALSSAFRRLALHYPASGFAKQAGPLLDEWERELNGIWLDAIDPAVSAWINRSEYPPKLADIRREVRALMPKHEPVARHQEPACLTCGRLEPEWVEAVPVGSQTGHTRLFCRCAITTGHALYADEWRQLQSVRLPHPAHAA